MGTGLVYLQDLRKARCLAALLASPGDFVAHRTAGAFVPGPYRPEAPQRRRWPAVKATSWPRTSAVPRQGCRRPSGRTPGSRSRASEQSRTSWSSRCRGRRGRRDPVRPLIGLHASGLAPSDGQRSSRYLMSAAVRLFAAALFEGTACLGGALSSAGTVQGWMVASPGQNGEVVGAGE
jgi:hypothetical protein